MKAMMKALVALVCSVAVKMGEGFIADDPMDRVYLIQACELDQKMRKKAVCIQRNLGTRSAAGYLRNRGIELGTALKVLAGSKVVRL